MSELLAIGIVGVGLLVTLFVGIAAQYRHRIASNIQESSTFSFKTTKDQQEDLDALSKSIEDARAELLWLRDQIAKERINLEHFRRQAPRSHTAHGAAHGSYQGSPYTQWERSKPPSAPMTHSQNNPWVILGLRPGASQDDIRRRYRLLSRVWHPDRFTDGTPDLRAEAEMMMARLNQAHKTLDLLQK